MESLPGNPWWSEPGQTLDSYSPSETAGRHRADDSFWTERGHAERTVDLPSLVAGSQPKHRAEPDPAPSSPVRTTDRRATLADLATASRAPSFDAWIKARHRALQVAIEASGATGKAHFAVAVRRALAARPVVDREDPSPALGPDLGTVAEGTDATGALHGTGRDEDPGRTEDDNESGTEAGRTHPKRRTDRE